MAIDDDFLAPISMQEAEERRVDLIAEIEDIQSQIGNPAMITERGPEWRSKALGAMNGRLDELRRIKLWIKLNREEAG